MASPAIQKEEETENSLDGLLSPWGIVVVPHDRAFIFPRGQNRRELALRLDQDLPNPGFFEGSLGAKFLAGRQD